MKWRIIEIDDPSEIPESGRVERSRTTMTWSPDLYRQVKALAEHLTIENRRSGRRASAVTTQEIVKMGVRQVLQAHKV